LRLRSARRILSFLATNSRNLFLIRAAISQPLKETQRHYRWHREHDGNSAGLAPQEQIRGPQGLTIKFSRINRSNPARMPAVPLLSVDGLFNNGTNRPLGLAPSASESRSVPDRSAKDEIPISPAISDTGDWAACPTIRHNRRDQIERCEPFGARQDRIRLFARGRERQQRERKPGRVPGRPSLTIVGPCVGIVNVRHVAIAACHLRAASAYSMGVGEGCSFMGRVGVARIGTRAAAVITTARHVHTIDEEIEAPARFERTNLQR
jgi:hypothetical protein